MLHWTIRIDDFYRNTRLQHCCDIVSNSYNIVPIVRRCVALKIVRCESSRVTSPLGSLSKGVLNNARPSTGNGLFAFMSSGFSQYFGPIVSIRVKKLSKISWVASGHIEREKGSHSVDVHGTVNAFA